MIARALPWLPSTPRVDAFLLPVLDEVIEAASARPDRPNLERGSHREGHLDQIERALPAHFPVRAEP